MGEIKIKIGDQGHRQDLLETFMMYGFYAAEAAPEDANMLVMGGQSRIDASLFRILYEETARFPGSALEIISP